MRVTHASAGTLGALVTALALTACTAGAPKIVATGTGTTGTTSSTSPTSTPETTSTTPTTSTSSVDGAVCSDAYQPSTKVGSTQMKPYGSSVDTDYSGGTGGKVTVQVSKGTPMSAGSQALFFGDGYQALLFDVKFTWRSGFSIASTTQFTLRDASGTACQQDVISGLIPMGQRLTMTIMRSEGSSASGRLVFKVPTGADYSKYQMLWNSDSGGDALIGWE